MIISVKNMVCQRCITIVTDVFAQAGLKPVKVTLGEVDLSEKPNAAQLEEIDAQLSYHGFERINDAKVRLIEKIKTIIIQEIYASDKFRRNNFSDLIASQLHKDYTYLSNLFSEKEGITIERYCILQRIERVKELLVYDELSLSQIAHDTGYSSVAHLSAQFKKVTGLTPGYFKGLKVKRRLAPDKLIPVNDIKRTKNDVTKRKKH